MKILVSVSAKAQETAVYKIKRLDGFLKKIKKAKYPNRELATFGTEMIYLAKRRSGISNPPALMESLDETLLSANDAILAIGIERDSFPAASKQTPIQKLASKAFSKAMGLIKNVDMSSADEKILERYTYLMRAAARLVDKREPEYNPNVHKGIADTLNSEGITI